MQSIGIEDDVSVCAGIPGENKELATSCSTAQLVAPCGYANTGTLCMFCALAHANQDVISASTLPMGSAGRRAW